MSKKELSKLEIIQKILSKRLTYREASSMLDVSERQLYRLVGAYRQYGAQGLASKKRGKIANNRLENNVKSIIISIISDKYYDFGPTLACEKLAENHDIFISKETTRKIMIKAGLWKTRAQKLKRAYQPRYRRETFGELIQIDGSDHDWFEGRAPKCTLLVYIDDATSSLLELRFVKEESTFTYFESTKQYISQYGKPVAFYSDKLSVFRVNAKESKGGDKITQFGRALNDLNIDIICAETCQAKGRVERANKTLQDRLVKEMRLNNISTIKEANEYLPKFIEIYNNKFAKLPKNPRNAHRELQSHENLNDILCWQEERTLSNNLTFQYNKILYLVENTLENRTLKRNKITVFHYNNGEIKAKFGNRWLKYSLLYDRVKPIVPQEQGNIVDNKRLGHVLDYIKDKQKELDNNRSKSVPKEYHKAEWA